MAALSNLWQLDLLSILDLEGKGWGGGVERMDVCLGSLHLNLIVHLHEFVYYIHFYILLNEYVLSLQVV